MASRLSFADLPFMQGAQQGNPSGYVPSSSAFGSISNMLYTAVMAGAAGNSINVTHQPAEFAIPAKPSVPTFTGTLHTVGTGGTFATLTAALDNASVQNGHRLQLVGASITEPAAVNITKQVEIFSAVNTVVQRNSITGVLFVQSQNVYIHDFTITNNQLASADGGGQSSCITAGTMSRTAYDGFTGIYIKNMTFNHPKVGVSISGTGWVVTDCTFNVNAASQTAGVTIRHVFLAGTAGNCFVENNTINTTLDSRRSVGIYLEVVADGIAPAYATGHKGALVLKNNTIVKNGSVGAPRAYIDATGFYRQPGLASSNGSLNQFSLYVVNNNFGTDYASSPCVFFGRTGVLPFAFFNTLLVQNNTFGKSTTGSEKGALFFTSASGLASNSMGTFGGTFYASNNTITAATLATPNFSIMAVEPTALMVRDNTYYAAPAPLLTPAEPVGSFSVSVVGDAVTVNVPTNNPATSLASSLNANGSFAALVGAVASDGGNASTTGTVTLSGGAG
jgi:hypothetical protein